MWAESTVTTYTFNSKSWGATCNGSVANWTGSADGNQYSASNSPIGVQILAAGNGTTVTSPKSFTNVSKVVVNYSSSSKGVGSIKVSVGGTDIDTKSISKSQSKVDLTYAPTTNLSGNVVITCNCTTNSYALVSVSITEETGGSTTPTVTAPTFDVEAGTYTKDQLVLIDNYDGDYLYAYTLDGSDPAFDEELNVTKGIEYDNDEGIEITSSCTLKAIAIDEDGNMSTITSAAYVINKPYTSLEQLVAATLASGTEVTVSFENVPIKSFQTVSTTRKGVYFDIQKDGKDIEIYFNSAIPAEWAEGGTLSGTLTNCPWKLYSGTWELAPASGWAWTNLTYTAPAQKTITALEVSGSPTKTTYNVGDEFDPTGLAVTATYSDNTQEVISTGFDWEIDYGTDNVALVAGATSVDVMAYTEDQQVTSNVYTVNGLTVNVPVTLTSITISGTPTKTEYYVGDAFETAGLVVTGHYSDGNDKDITEEVDWTVDPETLTLGTTSVNVLAGVGTVTSKVYTVEGLTVTKPDFETVTYDFSSFTSGQTVELTNLDGFVITLAKGEGTTNPAWSSNQARVYAKGSLTVKASNATIKSIEYDYAVNANSKGKVPTIDGVAGTTAAGTWDVENKTWTGADEEVTFSTSGDAGNIGFTKLVIKYVESNKVETSLVWSATEAEVTIGADDNVFPTLTTTPGDLAGVTYESSNTEVATIDVDGTITLVKIGETTITANYAGDAEHAAATPVSYTLTVVKAPFVPTPVEEGYETVDFTAIEPYASLTGTQSATVEDYEGTSFAMAFAKPQSSTTPTKFYESGNSVRAYKGNTITITGAEPITKVKIAWSKEKGEDTEIKFEGLGTTTAVVTFANTCSFTAITVDYRTQAIITLAEACTDGENYYSTYSNESAWVIPEGMTAAEISIVDGKLNVKEYKLGSVVPANTGVMVSAERFGNYSASLTNETGTSVLGEANALHPSSEAMTGDNLFYRLTMHNGTEIGFWWGAAEGAAFNLAANKAYLAVPKTAESNLRLWFGDETVTGIEAVENTAERTIYNLQGQRIQRLQQGVNIINGRKVLR